MRSFFVFAGVFILLFGPKAKGTVMSDAAASNGYVKLQLFKDAVNKDETVIIFKNKAKQGYDPKEDARYLQGNGQVRMFSYATNQTALVFNTQPFPVLSSSTRLNVFTRTDGIYSLKLTELVNMPRQFDVWLIDNFKKDSLDLRANSSYSFNVSKADTNTFGGGRFKVVFKRSKARLYHLLSFATNKVTGSKQIEVKWRTENEADNTNFVVERSLDNGKTFNIVDSLLSDDNGNYVITDNKPADGINLYRLKQKDFMDSVSFSAVVKADLSVIELPTIKSTTNNTPCIYPNPVTNQVNIAMADKLPAGNYSITITNIFGLKVKEGNTSGPQWQGEVGDLKPGIYMVKITSSIDKNVVGYNKFMKR